MSSKARHMSSLHSTFKKLLLKEGWMDGWTEGRKEGRKGVRTNVGYPAPAGAATRRSKPILESNSSSDRSAIGTVLLLINLKLCPSIQKLSSYILTLLIVINFDHMEFNNMGSRYLGRRQREITRGTIDATPQYCSP